jgi:hypothetical protein
MVESVLLFWILWTDCGAELSLDVLLGRRRRGPVPALPVRLIQIQLALIYFFTAIEKSDLGWYGGHALGRILQLEEFARPTAPWMLHFPSVLRVLSTCVPPMEAIIAILILTPWRRSRWLAVLLAWSLHGAIFILMNVGMFSLLMPAAMTIVLPPRAPAIDEPLRWRYRWLIPLALMMLAICSLSMALYDQKLPMPLMRTLRAAGLDQRWPMFSQTPGIYDFHWRASGERVDGAHVDGLLAQLVPHLGNPSRHLTYARWIKFAEALRNPELARVFAIYLCRRGMVADVPLKSIELYLVARDIELVPRPGVERARDNRMLHQDCLATP